MKLGHFFNFSWMLQLLVGVGLFTVSFMLENLVLASFITLPYLALLLAVGLELGKAAAIIWNRYLAVHPQGTYPLSTRLTSLLFRTGLLLLSLLCSLLFLAGNLDRPFLEAARSADTEQLERQIHREQARWTAQRTQRVADLKHRQAQEYGDLKQIWAERVQVLEVEKRMEMDNVINGIFKGARYTTFEQALIEAKSGQAHELSALSHRQISQLDALDMTLAQGLDVTHQARMKQFEDERQALVHKDYAEDERANDPRIVALLKLMESVFGVHWQPLQFVLVFSLLLSILMELGIVLAFDTITVAVLPGLLLARDAHQQSESIQATTVNNLYQDNRQHEASMNRARKAADDAVDKANQYIRGI